MIFCAGSTESGESIASPQLQPAQVSTHTQPQQQPTNTTTTTTAQVSGLILLISKFYWLNVQFIYIDFF